MALWHNVACQAVYLACHNTPFVDVIPEHRCLLHLLPQVVQELCSVLLYCVTLVGCLVLCLATVVWGSVAGAQWWASDKGHDRIHLIRTLLGIMLRLDPDMLIQYPIHKYTYIGSPLSHPPRSKSLLSPAPP